MSKQYNMIDNDTMWTELVDPAQLQTLDYTYRVWCDPWKEVFLQVRFAETDRAEKEQEDACLSPLYPAQTTLNHWIKYHIHTMQPLENGFTWQHRVYTTSKVVVLNDLVYFHYLDVCNGEYPDGCVVPLSIINEILSHFSGAENEHRRQRQHLLKNRNWNYSIFAYRSNSIEGHLGVAFDDSLTEHFSDYIWQNRCSGQEERVDSLSYELWNYLLKQLPFLLKALEHRPRIETWPYAFVCKDGWVEWYEYHESDFPLGYLFHGCLPHRVFRDILLDMQKLSGKPERIPKDVTARPRLFTRTYTYCPDYKVKYMLSGNCTMLDLSQFENPGTSSNSDHRSSKDWKQNCLSGKRWPPP